MTSSPRHADRSSVVDRPEYLRRRALWRTWANSAVRQAREAKQAGEPAIALAFLKAAALCADAAVEAVRAAR